MAAPVIMPRQGQSVESCILTVWYKEVGDKISAGDLLFAYETDKAAFEEEAHADGILLAKFYSEGDEVPVLSNLAVIGQEGESVDEFRPAPQDAEIRRRDDTPGRSKGTMAGPEAQGTGEKGARHPAVTGETGASHPAGTGEKGTPHPAGPLSFGGKSPVSPRARKLAREKRIAVHAITGTGPGGRVIERDISEEIRKGRRLTPLAQKKLEGEGLMVPEAGCAPYGKISARELVEVPGATVAPSLIEGGFSEEPLSSVRRIIATAMHRSLRHSAQLTHHLGANATGLLRLRKEVKGRLEKGYEFNITLNDMVCYAVVRALKLHPGANAHFMGGTIRRFHKVNLGVAVDTERGLLVPVIPGADDLSLTGLSVRLAELVEASRTGSISPDLLAPEAASFTVTNLGNYGVEMFTPVVNLPQVGILGVNTIIHRPVELAGGTFGFEPFIGLSLTYDHRAIDGGPATRFLAEIRHQIEALSPEML
jgi:pyruvate dehydrogenase E2 component (dihydrolipoamide acetyltransferase)